MAKRPSRRHAASDSELQRSSGGILNADADVDANLNLGYVLERDRTVLNAPGSTHNSGLNLTVNLRGKSKKGRNKESSGGDS